MKRSTSRILTTHVGSLPRPDDVIELAARRQAGEAVDPAAYHARLAEAVAAHARGDPLAIGMSPGAARAILEMAGVKDIIAKSLGSSNGINVAHATIEGLKQLRRPEEIASLRDQPADHVIPSGTLRAYRERQREGDLFKTEG